MNDFVGNFLQN